MSIQRYNTIHPHAYRAGIIKEPDGKFVLYTDHLAAMAQVTRERDEAVEALRAYSTGTLPDYGAWKIEGGWRRVIVGIQGHARAVLAKIEGGRG